MKQSIPFPTAGHNDTGNRNGVAPATDVIKDAGHSLTDTVAQADADALTKALRQSFQATLDETVPDSLMDLINKLK